MSGDQGVGLIWGVGALVLVLSSLVARRLPIGQALKMALGWVAIFALGILLYSYRAEFKSVWARVSGELLGNPAQVVGGTLRVPKSADGHFWVTADVDGASIRFLIDSGATTIALSEQAARAAGVDVDAGGFPVMINTANGAIEARRARIERLELGPIVARDMAAVVSPSFGEMNVLGMNFLSALRSWRVEGDMLVLEPRGEPGPL